MEFNYEKIEKYIKGELTSSELQSFEQEMADNASLKEEVALYKDVNERLSNHFKFEEQDAAVETTLAKLRQKYVTEGGKHFFEKKKGIEVEQATQKSNTTITRRLFPLAALAAAVALLLFLFNPFGNRVSSTELAEQHFIPHELDTFMGGGDIETTWKNAVKFYRTEDYENALQNFNLFLKNMPGNKEALLAKGSCEFRLNQTDTAIQTFQQIKNSKTAEWYLALAYLKIDQVEKAKPLLQKLSIQSNYDKKAKALLKNL